jgi:hypothetical protein
MLLRPSSALHRLAIARPIVSSLAAAASALT